MASAWLKDSKVGPFFLFLFFAPSLYRSFKEMNWNAAEGMVWVIPTLDSKMKFARPKFEEALDNYTV